MQNNISKQSATFSGRSLIGFRQGKGSGEPFYAVDPVSAQPLRPGFVPATAEDLDLAARLATEAFASYGRLSGRERGAFLRKIADKIESVTSDIVDRAGQETALPQARLQGEIGRTCAQLRLFAQVADEGPWVDARIDRADPDRKPAPKPDIRSMLRPLGPVAVFGASNFPLAFSVAGGDTASALASGNPIIVKAHPAHPGTSELVGQQIRDSVKECALPEGVFSLLFDSGNRIGIALVQHPLVKACGFTGSRTAGRGLMDIAAARPEPIPFYAEMSSTNPLFILPGALRERGEAIAAGLYTSFTLGAGQFCTKPGIVFLPTGDQSHFVTSKLRELVEGSAPFYLLTKSIRASYQSAIAARKSEASVGIVAEAAEGKNTGLAATSILFEVDAAAFLSSHLEAEIFGPTTLLVRHSNREQLLAIANALEGHLTATIHGTEQDLHDFADLVEILAGKVGRLIFNGFPTGVEVNHAMVHGGPYPATSDGRSTSVGTRAIFRFARPVCYQSFPDSALPRELQDANPLAVWRMVDGQMTREAIPPAPESAR